MRQNALSIKSLLKSRAGEEAQGRLRERSPVAIMDIGSNSVRQVIYEGLTRSPSILFNEKVLCGLGRGVARNNRLEPEAVERALRAIRRFVQLARHLEVAETYIVATAAARDAENGEEFVSKIEEITGGTVNLLTGREEAELAAFGIKASFHKPRGIAGDLGGGSMELIRIDDEITNGVTTPLGGLRLAELSGGNIAKAEKIARDTLKNMEVKWPGNERTFYAIGGTWRSLARLYMLETGHPVHVVHGYVVKAKACIRFCRKLAVSKLDENANIGAVSKNRRDLLPYGAIVMAEVLERLGAERVAMSGAGLREGLLYSKLDDETRARDALLEATGELAVLRARSPMHSRELAAWTGAAFETLGISENDSQRRWRLASCNLADIVWRSASDFRAEQTLGIIANAGFTSISHEGRAFLALVAFHRYQGFRVKLKLPAVAGQASRETARLARILAAMFRLLYLFSAGEAGTLGMLRLERNPTGRLVLRVPDALIDLVGEKTDSRLSDLAGQIGEEVVVLVG